MTQIILATSKAYIAARAVLGDHRKVYDSVTDAIAAVRSIYAKTDFPADFPVMAARVGLIDVSTEATIPDVAEWAEGAYLADGIQVAVSFIGVRNLEIDVNGEKKKANGAKGLVIYPIFGIDNIVANDDGGEWLMKIIEKEMSHVAFRNLRNVPLESTTEELGAAAKGMPASVGDYVEESTREGLDTSAFDSVWNKFRKLLKGEASTTLLVDALPAKQEVIKSLRSKAYAVENYGDLESMGAFTFIGSTMVKVIDMANAAAIEAGEDTVDSGEIAGWMTKRDTFVFPAQVKKPLESGAVDFGAFMAKLG